MADTERALDKVTITVDIYTIKLIKLESVYRKPGMSRSAAVDAALDELLKDVKTTKAMRDKEKEIYDANLKKRQEGRIAWENGAKKPRKRKPRKAKEVESK